MSSRKAADAARGAAERSERKARTKRDGKPTRKERATRKSVPRPWPYRDIPRPPALVGIDLVSVPEAVGIIGATLHGPKWPTPPESWRKVWGPLWAGELLTSAVAAPTKELRQPDGTILGTVSGSRTVEKLEETEAARAMLRQCSVGLGAMLAQGDIRALAAFGARGRPRAHAGLPSLLVERQCVELDRSGGRWAVALLHGQDSVYWHSRWYERDLRGGLVTATVDIYLVRSDVTAITSEQAREAADEARGGRPRAEWKDILYQDVCLLGDVMRRRDGKLKTTREVMAELEDQSDTEGLVARYKALTDASGTTACLMMEWSGGIVEQTFKEVERALKPLRKQSRANPV